MRKNISKKKRTVFHPLPFVLIFALVGFTSHWFTDMPGKRDGCTPDASAAGVMDALALETEGLDTYEFATRVLPKTGHHYEKVIEVSADDALPVEITVGGKTLPEGTYTIRLIEGDGAVSVDDQENLIYGTIPFSADHDDERTVTEKKDVRLYKGAVVTVGENAEGVKLLFVSDNVQ